MLTATNERTEWSSNMDGNVVFDSFVNLDADNKEAPSTPNKLELNGDQAQADWDMSGIVDTQSWLSVNEEGNIEENIEGMEEEAGLVEENIVQSANELNPDTLMADAYLSTTITPELLYQQPVAIDPLQTIHPMDSTQQGPVLDMQKIGEKKKSKRKLYCICKQPNDNIRPMIMCDGPCRDWFHSACVGLTDDQVENMPDDRKWLCPTCSQLPASRTYQCTSILSIYLSNINISTGLHEEYSHINEKILFCIKFCAGKLYGLALMQMINYEAVHIILRWFSCISLSRIRTKLQKATHACH